VFPNCDLNPGVVAGDPPGFLNSPKKGHAMKLALVIYKSYLGKELKLTSRFSIAFY
jgi:hypothetical protein